MMLGFVFEQPVNPDPPGRVDITTSDEADFTRPAAGEQLELDHCGDLRPDIRENGVDHHLRHWLDRGRFSGFRPTALQPGNRL